MTYAFSKYVTDALAVVFALSALLQLSGFRFVHALYERWEYPRSYHIFAGSMSLTTAVFLAVPQTLVWGVFVAAVVLFVAVVMLLSRRHYFSALSAIIMFASLPAVLVGNVGT